MPSTLHITNYTTDRRVSAIRAVRIARTDLDEMPADRGLRAAQAVVDNLRESGEPQYVGSHDDPDRVKAALKTLQDHGCEGALNLIVEADESGVEQDDENVVSLRAVPDDPDEVALVEVEIASATLVLMAVCQGNPAYARAAAGSLALALGEEPWDGVQALLKITFPSDPSDPTAGYDVS